MSQRSYYDSIKAAIEADLRAGRRPVLTEIAQRVGCLRPTVSRLVHRGLPPSRTSAGAPPLLPLLGRPHGGRGPRAATEPTADGLRHRLFGLAVRAADRADNTLADPDAAPAAIEGAVKIVVALAGVADKLGARGDKGKSSLRQPDAPPAAVPPTPEDDDAAEDALDARLAAIAAKGAVEPQPTEAPKPEAA